MSLQAWNFALEELKQKGTAFSSRDPLRKLREKGWSCLEKVGLPSKQQEAYRYLPLRELYQHPFTCAPNAPLTDAVLAGLIPQRAKGCSILFVNGFFRPDLSDITALPSQVQLIPLSDAIRSHASFLMHRLSTSISEEKDPFVALNASLHGEGAFLYIPPHLDIEQPIHCIYVHTEEGAWSFPRLHLFIGKQSTVRWITRSCGGSGAGNGSGVLDATLEEGAQWKLAHALASSEGSWHFEAVRTTLKKNSRFHSVTLFPEQTRTRHDYHVVLMGEGAEARMFGLTTLREKGQSHAHLCIEHAAPHTYSLQRFKTVLDGNAQASFEGKIHVHQEAQKTEAYQLNNNLLLDDRAIANSKPNLMIFADDVKASHGVTMAQIEPSLLFYLRTRGISEKEAKHLLTRGFCQEVLEEIPYPFLAEEMQMKLNTFLDEQER